VPDFKQKRAILKNPHNVDDFLKLATVRVLRHALDESQLITDLRDC